MMYKGFYGIVAPVTTVAAIAAIMAFQPAGGAFAGEVSSGNDKISLSLSGHINRAVLYADDGNRSNFIHVDNNNSSTRWRLIGKGKVNDEVSAGAQVEVDMRSSSSAKVGIDGESGAAAGGFRERKLEWYIDHARLGRIWVGQGDTATQKTSEVDLSGTSLIGDSAVKDIAGGIFFTQGGVPSEKINNIFVNFDGLSRDDRIRYDTPNFGGFKVSASNSEDTKSDAAVRYSGKAGGVKIAGAVAWATQSSTHSQINGSVSLLHGSGVNLTLAGGQRDFDDTRENPTFYYTKLGIKFGDTALSVDYYVHNDVAGAAGDEATSFGILAVRKLKSAATELYAGGRIHAFQTGGVDQDDITAVMVGARVKF